MILQVYKFIRLAVHGFASQTCNISFCLSFISLCCQGLATLLQDLPLLLVDVAFSRTRGGVGGDMEGAEGMQEIGEVEF